MTTVYQKAEFLPQRSVWFSPVLSRSLGIGLVHNYLILSDIPSLS